ncbi:MAG: ATP synthase F1 subunit delta [Methylotenera sp.]|nr:ATP synthase F1 subunit delta [Oligoflexia bacterium]
MSVARAYAKALYEAATETKLTAADVDQIEAQLDAFVLAVDQNPNFKTLIETAALGSKEKISVVAAVSEKLGIGGILGRFLVLMARKERLSLLKAIRGSFAEIRLESQGGVLGQLVSADPLDAKDLEELSRSFGQKLGKKISFRPSIDSSLLAGIKVTVNGVTYDGTLRSQLQQLRDRLVFGTSSAN